MCLMDSLCSSSLSHSLYYVCARVCHVNALDWNSGFKGIVWNVGKYAHLLSGRDVGDHFDDQWSQSSHLMLDERANKHISQNAELSPQGDSLVYTRKRILCRVYGLWHANASVFMINGMLSDSYNLYKIGKIGWFYDIYFIVKHFIEPKYLCVSERDWERGKLLVHDLVAHLVWVTETPLLN